VFDYVFLKFVKSFRFHHWERICCRVVFVFYHKEKSLPPQIGMLAAMTTHGAAGKNGLCCVVMNWSRQATVAVVSKVFCVFRIRSPRIH
jgi:hypothetical protein